MIVLWVLSALGPCADVATCTFKLRTSDELAAPARAAMTSLRLTPVADKPGFSLEVERQGEEIVVRALKAGKPPSLYGLARVKPQPLSQKGPRARALEIAIRSGIERAMEDLSAQLLEAVGQGSRKLRLSVRVNGLDGPSRKVVAETFLPCLKGQFDALGPVTEAREIAGYLEEDLEYAPAKDEPRDSLQWQADRLRALTLGAKARCPPPAKWVAAFSADTVNRGVTIELR